MHSGHGAGRLLLSPQSRSSTCPGFKEQQEPVPAQCWDGKLWLPFYDIAERLFQLQLSNLQSSPWLEERKCGYGDGVGNGLKEI